MNQNQPHVQDPDPEDREEQLQLFVTLLTVQVLKKCHAFKDRSRETWVPHTNRLINQTMEGLCVPEGFCPKLKHLRKVSNGVVWDLKKQLCGRQIMECLIILQDPAVDTTIARTMQTRIMMLSRPTRWNDFSDWWRQTKEAVGFFAGSIATVLSPIIHPCQPQSEPWCTASFELQLVLA